VVGEALTWVEPKVRELHVLGLTVAAAPAGCSVLLAMEAKAVQVFAAPAQQDLKNAVQIRKGRIARDQNSPPYQRADAGQHQAELIDGTGVCQDGSAHLVSLPLPSPKLEISYPPEFNALSGYARYQRAQVRMISFATRWPLKLIMTGGGDT
jgi:hypothetical protein